MTVPDALDVLRQLAAELGDRVVLGAGTVLDADTARACIAAGAQFIVAPGLDLETVRAAQELDTPVMPGALTPTEVITAWKAGADMVKIFPCSAVGGADYVRALKAPLPQVKLLPTGGVDRHTAADYIRAGAAALGLGAALIDLKVLQQQGDEALVGSRPRAGRDRARHACGARGADRWWPGGSAAVSPACWSRWALRRRASAVRAPCSVAALLRAAPGEAADLVVAQDGSGDFRTIQEALDALPADAPGYRIILLRNGTYREKIFITKSRVALVGEDRERTRLVFSELRSEWRKTHPDDWGAAVVNVGDGVEDLVLANLTIHNDYGSRGGSHDHQFAVRSGKGTTRISVLHANVIADGGDTISLWNSASGMYYHASSTLRGLRGLLLPAGVELRHGLPFLRPQHHRQHLARRQRRGGPEARDPELPLRRRPRVRPRAHHPRRAVLPSRLHVLGGDGRSSDLPRARAGDVPVGPARLLLELPARGRRLPLVCRQPAPGPRRPARRGDRRTLDVRRAGGIPRRRCRRCSRSRASQRRETALAPSRRRPARSGGSVRATPSPTMSASVGTTRLRIVARVEAPRTRPALWRRARPTSGASTR